MRRRDERAGMVFAPSRRRVSRLRRRRAGQLVAASAGEWTVMATSVSEWIRAFLHSLTLMATRLYRRAVRGHGPSHLDDAGMKIRLAGRAGRAGESRAEHFARIRGLDNRIDPTAGGAVADVG